MPRFSLGGIQLNYPDTDSAAKHDMHVNQLKHGAMLPDIDLTMFKSHQRSYRQSSGPIVDAGIDN